MQMKNDIVVTHVKPVSMFGRGSWKLTQDAVFHGHLIPAGFVTDGISVPRILCFIFPSTWHAFNSSILHDFMLTKGDRNRADIIFRETMILDGVPAFQRALFYYSARSASLFMSVFEPLINAYKWLRGK